MLQSLLRAVRLFFFILIIIGFNLFTCCDHDMKLIILVSEFCRKMGSNFTMASLPLNRPTLECI